MLRLATIAVLFACASGLTHRFQEDPEPVDPVRAAMGQRFNRKKDDNSGSPPELFPVENPHSGAQPVRAPMRALKALDGSTEEGELSRDDLPTGVSKHFCSQSTPNFCPSEEASMTNLMVKQNQSQSQQIEVVVSTFDEDLTWLSPIDVPITIYTHETNSHRTHGVMGGFRQIHREHPIKFKNVANKGDEAVGYLSHIIQNYDNLPAALFFVHGHECGWHNPFSMKQAIEATKSCVSKAGYIPLLKPDTSGASGPKYCFKTSGPESHRALQNSRMGEQETNHLLGNQEVQLQELHAVWNDMFQQKFGNMPETFCLDCCGQFAVSRERILTHKKEFYQHLLQKVNEGKTSMEYYWRMLFVPNFQ